MLSDCGLSFSIIEIDLCLAILDMTVKDYSEHFQHNIQTNQTEFNILFLLIFLHNILDKDEIYMAYVEIYYSDSLNNV